MIRIEAKRFIEYVIVAFTNSLSGMTEAASNVNFDNSLTRYSRRDSITKGAVFNSFIASKQAQGFCLNPLVKSSYFRYQSKHQYREAFASLFCKLKLYFDI